MVGTTSYKVGHDTDFTIPGRHKLFFDQDLSFNSDAKSDDSFISRKLLLKWHMNMGTVSTSVQYAWPSSSNISLVLGTEHEHQRIDRKSGRTLCQVHITYRSAGDRYLDLKCDKLADYDEWKAICDKITNCDIEQVCRV